MSEAKKAAYRVKGIAIKHDGVLYAEGETIELSSDEAKPLKAWLGSVGGADKAGPKLPGEAADDKKGGE